jgi:hypothetical protein
MSDCWVRPEVVADGQNDAIDPQRTLHCAAQALGVRSFNLKCLGWRHGCDLNYQTKQSERLL